MIDKLLEQGVRQGVFPSASAVVVLEGKPVFTCASGAATTKTVFDLASITKVLSTTALFVRLWSDGKVSLETPIASLVKTQASAIALADLLYHRSGLPGFVPYFAHVLPSMPELLSENYPPESRRKARSEVVARALATMPQRPPGHAVEYSDVGFIWLGEALSGVAQSPLDSAFQQMVAAPLGLDFRFHRLSVGENHADCAPTGRLRPREPAPGQENLWPSLEQRPSRAGEVDDDNAWVLDGVAGHAGLFGTASSLASFGQRVLEELEGANRLAPASLWQKVIQVDGRVPGSTRALGFDTPAVAPGSLRSSAGKYIAASQAIGHLGFTGTSLWIDLRRRLVVALCTNRSYLGRANEKIREFRPLFHDRVVEVLGLEGGA